MLALMEAVPYIAFVGAGLLIAFVAGEAMYKKFLALRLGAFGAKPAIAVQPASAPAPTPKITVQNESSDRVQVLDNQLNVRIEDVTGPVAGVPDSDRQAASSQDSAKKTATSDELQPVVDKIVTVEMPILAEAEKHQPVPFGEEDDKLSRANNVSLEEGNLCNEVVAIRRDPSVRVFDAVVAPSERKSSAA